MSDRLFYPLAALTALALVALALVWPQGQGRRSPAPFGGPLEEPAYVRVERARAAAQAPAPTPAPAPAGAPAR